MGKEMEIIRRKTRIGNGGEIASTKFQVPNLPLVNCFFTEEKHKGSQRFFLQDKCF